MTTAIATICVVGATGIFCQDFARDLPISFPECEARKDIMQADVQAALRRAQETEAAAGRDPIHYIVAGVDCLRPEFDV